MSNDEVTITPDEVGALPQAINEMRNMRESYDQIAGAAEAYNTGKTELAANITSKGVQASATETLPELAEKVAAISQETYEINGGEMYAEQLFGSLETPNYWNLYDILAQLLSDGRLINYGGILLAEYYRGYDSLALAGAGAGGAYVVSDKDENGQFKMYTEDTTHVWATEFDGKGNRWVAYCFADEYHDFQITDTNTSPRSIFIGRKVGTITCLVAGRASQIVVPDGNELKDFVDVWQNYSGRIVLRNIKEHTSGNCIVLPQNVYSIYCKIGKLNGGNLIATGFNLNSRNDCSVILDFTEEENTSAAVIFSGQTLRPNYLPLFIIRGCKKYIGTFASSIRGCDVFVAEDLEVWGRNGGSYGFGGIDFHKAYFPSLEGIENIVGYSFLFLNVPQYIYFGYKQNDKTRSIWALFERAQTITTDIELKEGYCKPIDLSLAQGLTKENVQAHIFDRLGVNDLSTGAVTITLATAVLNLFTQEEIDAVVARTNITIVGA